MRNTKQKLFEFRFIGHCPNFNELKNCILSLSEDDWNSFTYRQNNIVGHKNTLTIPLLFDYKTFNKEVKHKHYEKFEQYLEQISNYLASLGELSKIQRANVVLLKAKSLISSHIDKGEFLQSTRRIHIPITTNEDCYFVIDEKQQHLKESELWEINNTGRYHSFHNEGQTDRIHLIIDIA